MIGISIASCVGLTLILKYGKPTKSIRDYFKNKVKGLFECSLCLGFWAGIIHCILLLLIVPSAWLIMLPFASAALSWLADTIILGIEMIEIYLKEKIKSL